MMRMILSEWDFSTTTVDEAIALDLQWRPSGDGSSGEMIPVRFLRPKSARGTALFCKRMDRMDADEVVSVVESNAPHTSHRVKVRDLSVVLHRTGTCVNLRYFTWCSYLLLIFVAMTTAWSEWFGSPTVGFHRSRVSQRLNSMHSLHSIIHQHEFMADNSVPLSVLWTPRDDAAVSALLGAFEAVRRVRVCDSADLDAIQQLQRRHFDQNDAQQTLVLVEQPCAPQCQDALTMWLDDSLPLVRKSAKQMYFVLVGSRSDDDECQLANMVARVRHRITNNVSE